MGHAVPGGVERTTCPEDGHGMLCPYLSIRPSPRPIAPLADSSILADAEQLVLTP